MSTTSDECEYELSLCASDASSKLAIGIRLANQRPDDDQLWAWVAAELSTTRSWEITMPVALSVGDVRELRQCLERLYRDQIGSVGLVERWEAEEGEVALTLARQGDLVSLDVAVSSFCGSASFDLTWSDLELGRRDFELLVTQVRSVVLAIDG
jgi:hypothetical protein